MLISACLLLTGCDGNETYTIPVQDRPFFNTGDTLYFKDISGDTDTLAVIVGPWIEQHDKADTYEHLVIRYQLVKNKVIDNLDLLRVTQYANGGTGINRKGIPFKELRTVNQFQLSNGTVLDRVTEFERYPQVNDPVIDLVYFAPHYGIVKYKYHSGAVFELVLP